MYLQLHFDLEKACYRMPRESEMWVFAEVFFCSYINVIKAIYSMRTIGEEGRDETCPFTHFVFGMVSVL